MLSCKLARVGFLARHQVVRCISSTNYPNKSQSFLKSTHTRPINTITSQLNPSTKPHRRTLAHSTTMSSADASSIESVRKVSHILLPHDQSTLLNTLKSQLDSNLSLFPQLAAQHSTCPSKRAKGDIGWVSLGTTIQEFEQAAFAAPLNTPVTCDSPFGLHIILVTEEKKQYKVVQLTPQEVQEMIEASSLANDNDRLQLVDVREDWEFSTASVPGFKLFPITQMVGGWGDKVGEGEEGVVLDSSRPTICLCHHGVRSNQAAQWLANTKGFSQVYNMVGGIDAYSRSIDPNIPRY